MFVSLTDEAATLTLGGSFDAMAYLAHSVATLPRAIRVVVLLKTNLKMAREELFEAIGVFQPNPDGDGVLLPYLRSGTLRITETSFGETTARAAISDRLEDRRGSIYNPAAARERRVEIVEIKAN